MQPHTFMHLCIYNTDKPQWASTLKMHSPSLFCGHTQSQTCTHTQIYTVYTHKYAEEMHRFQPFRYFQFNENVYELLEKLKKDKKEEMCRYMMDQSTKKSCVL